MNRGNIKSIRKDYKEAVSDYNKAIDLNPRNAVCYECRANNALAAGWYAIAAVDYGRAIDISPEPIYYCRRGEVYMKMRDNKSAVRDFEKSLSISPLLLRAKRHLESLKLHATVFSAILPTTFVDVDIGFGKQ